MGAYPRIAGIILAAGTASRMGRVKQLLPFKDTTLLGQVIRHADLSMLDRVYVVLGYKADLIRQTLKISKDTIINNPDFHLGQSASLKAGIRHIDPGFDAAMFLLGDQPLVDSKTIDILIRGYRSSKARIVLPVYRNQRGNPVIVSAVLFPKILELTHDTGARELFKKYADKILKVEVNTPAVHTDIDTPGDYKKILRDHN